ncbi:hypothetical protein QBC35DRAFT_552287 [Podospora australis]|uniref:Uncharacterized protein n=1 Tax=Podospora australis TaxID=1536484 RepID=A0AAN6WHZ0_9PEZI|nr:hypothetical protein QBC35DRAFT_552287 [Podospora australis]
MQRLQAEERKAREQLEECISLQKRLEGARTRDKTTWINPRAEVWRLQERWRGKRQGPRPTWEERWNQKTSFAARGITTWGVTEQPLGGGYHWVQGDARQVDPLDATHAKIPWFQCITHDCRLHTKDKVLAGFWPVRKERHEKEFPVRKTFTLEDLDDLSLPSEQLWGQVPVTTLGDPARDMVFQQFIPRDVWPCGKGTAAWTSCSFQYCQRHREQKINAWHQSLPQHRAVTRPGSRRQGLERQFREATVSWLKDFNITEASESGDEAGRTERPGHY